jgi:hypothetical protein
VDGSVYRYRANFKLFAAVQLPDHTVGNNGWVRCSPILPYWIGESWQQNGTNTHVNPGVPPGSVPNAIPVLAPGGPGGYQWVPNHLLGNSDNKLVPGRFGKVTKDPR